jgi:hypothetical protein
MIKSSERMVIKKEKRNTQKKRKKPHMDAEQSEEDHCYYDIDTILRYSQEGSSYTFKKTKKRKYTETIQLLQALISYGWRDDYVLSMFGRLHDDMIVNWPHPLLIQKLFERLIEKEGFHDTIQRSLQHIGLREEIAIQLEVILLPLLDSSYTDIQVVTIGIEYLLGNYDPITSEEVTHPIESSTVHNWITYTHESKTIMIYNVPFPCNAEKTLQQCQRALRTLPGNSSEYRYCFHATSWGSAKSIMEHINHTAGRNCVDFGLRSGFYMSTQIEDAMDWCRKNKQRWNHEAGILVFRIPKKIPNSISMKYLQGEEWKEITRISRECKQSTNEIRELRPYDLLYGNMVRNPTMVYKRIEQPVPHDPAKKQLVGRTDKADEFLHNCLVGCVYFQKRL